MITDYQKFGMLDEGSGGKNWQIEVNWNPKDEKTNECKVLKITFPNGDQAYMKKEHLISLLFVIGTPREQVDLIPHKISKAKWYETVVGVKAKKDIAQGEFIRFPIKISLPVEEEEVIQKTNRVVDKGIYLPKS